MCSYICTVIVPVVELLTSTKFQLAAIALPTDLSRCCFSRPHRRYPILKHFLVMTWKWGICQFPVPAIQEVLRICIYSTLGSFECVSRSPCSVIISEAVFELDAWSASLSIRFELPLLSGPQDRQPGRREELKRPYPGFVMACPSFTQNIVPVWRWRRRRR